MNNILDPHLIEIGYGTNVKGMEEKKSLHDKHDIDLKQRNKIRRKTYHEHHHSHVDNNAISTMNASCLLVSSRHKLMQNCLGRNMCGAYYPE